MSVHSYLLTEEVMKLWHKLLENGATYVGSISLTCSAVWPMTESEVCFTPLDILQCGKVIFYHLALGFSHTNVIL